MRRCLAAVSVAVALVGLTAAPSSAAKKKPGWSLAKASAYIEFNLRIPDPDIIAAAKYYLAYMTKIGGPNGIAEAKKELAIATAGQTVDHASCLGLKAAPGGFVSFKCKLALSDELGFTAKRVGTWKRLATGKWEWSGTSATYGGRCPENWNYTTTNGFCQ